MQRVTHECCWCQWHGIKLFTSCSSKSRKPISPKATRISVRDLTERHFADTRFVAVYRIDRRTANVWGEWSSYPADKGTASINYDATLQASDPAGSTDTSAMYTLDGSRD
ncbi:uncharacterized protein LOC118644892 isoform X2 [Monomorium pharaonis]|uniref:uncharacterized protein LOC118644892 isoform X2 n=1 Tax=Monomorium pharaonis TaxID=307658 RepID=UPI001746946B|nr:uncharacterized protein LOC118644892 isoform X2 [Monomorium pharaonis]